ncbi:hypothetical protein [Streptomyces sp. A1136]|uniref:hypothetical protein n=1 Tax=Streptomyces sp. A1136 TaxID=2563102 RepID=UPI00109E6922|nr:hypothetical protein [Streptomyces sp. A1136]THA56107.1 hypothetical protein E6R62_12230 [Streptomyces sp. A1136]
MPQRTLPRHAHTGQTALGWRKARPGETPGELYPIWPILGGASDGDGEGGDQADDTDDSDTEDGGDDGQGDDTADHKAEAEKYKALMRKHEARAKENAAAAKELARIKREGMSDLDKKVDEAVAAARAEERVKSGVRVARSAFLAAASGRLENAKDVADDVNLKKYVDEDGEVDEDAIGELVNRLAPKKADKGEDDEPDERDTRRRRPAGGGYQGTRRRADGGKGGGTVADGAELYKQLLGGTKT